MTQDDPDSLDRLIDDVARGMTAAPVDEAFARRVSARLEDPGARAPWTRSRAWLLAPAAGAELLAVFATSLLRDGNVRLQPDATAVRKPDATAETASGTTAALSPRPLPPPAADSPVEPLVTPPLEFAALDVSPLVTVMPIEIQAIAIERIEIAPMP